MAKTSDFNNIANSELDQTLSEVTDPSHEVDNASLTGKETTWQNGEWATYNGFYREYPELQATIDKMALWSVGKGFKADASTTKKLETIKGFGKDTFNQIIENMIRVYLINGDSYAEIIKNPKTNKLINLKPLNPGAMKIVANSQGIIKRYEQTNITTKETSAKFKPEQIFHLSWNREADEIHGISIMENLKTTLKNIKQLDQDMAVAFHRYVVPMMTFHLDTDDPDEITKFKTKCDKAVNDGDNLYVPKDAVKPELMSVAQFSTLDPLKWRQEWVQSMVKTGGVPELILGRAADITEASSKIVYLAFQQTIERNQRFLEAQLKAQLGIEVQFEFPARIEENLGEDEGKDGQINKGKRSEVTIHSDEVKKKTGDPI